ncbi:VWA domain-containing protein [Dactylosporangium matsuzakiense]|uniref:VWFA domain-containing protein n=1 Tax=Dactylosporangium matsuzakiense TaxID=53360 RepID=A0A9W6KRX8_9ACTN|nr:VWA domain-containing protein [Dactylosporangium matsuzakiense]UWZ41487.1 VWA domain-containing protein [Dactylosporangium matsuzakiense]GLL07051.1 hypothetical protein GCM10017581_088020 [Dactylosporangium matsuzakiense]
MSLTWPWALLILLAFPLLLAYRWWSRRRRRKVAVRLPSVALVRAAVPGPTSWRRRVPLALLALGILFAGTAAARPQASVVVPDDAATILLAIDVSGSMCSTDVDPNRLTAAQKAAKEFIADHEGGAKIGLVAFSGTAGLLVPPTAEKDKLTKAIDGLRTSRGTAIGLAILASIDAIAEINPDVPPTGVEVPENSGNAPASGDYEPDTIVILTDGRNTDGVDPVTAAEQAAARRLRVYTIGFGTDRPSPMVCSSNQISGDQSFRGGGPGGGFGFGGRGRFQDMDEPTLTKVAEMTGAKYFKADNAEGLSDVLRDLPSQVTLQHRKTEISMWFALAAALAVLGAVFLAQWWSRPRPRDTGTT